MIHKLKTDLKWRLILLIFLITSVVSPYVFDLYRGYVGLWIFLFPLLFVLLISNFLKIIVVNYLNSHYTNKLMFFCIIWFILGVISTYFRGADDYQYLIQILFIILVFFFGLFIFNNYQYRFLSIFFIMLFVLLNILTTGDSIDLDRSARDIYLENNKSGLAGSTYFWAVVGIFYPVFLVRTLEEKNVLAKLFLIFCLLIFLFKIILSGFATPVVLLIINFVVIGVVSLFVRVKKVSDILPSVFYVSILFLLIWVIFNFMLTSDYSAISEVQTRLINFIDNPLGGGYSGIYINDSRFNLISFSWDTFSENPFFGGGGNIRTSIREGISGGHSSAIDFLAVLGLFGGGGAFLLFMFFSFRNVVGLLSREQSFKNISQFSTSLTFIIGGVMNPYWQGPLLIVFLLVLEIYRPGSKMIY